MKSVSDGPVTNHFSPLRTYSAGRRVLDGGRGQRARVRALARLGDRVAAVALAAQAGLEVAATLLGRAVHEDVVGARDEAPQAAGRLAQLLVDEDLLQRRPALAADRRRQAAAVEASLDGRPLELADGLVGERAAVALELGLERLEDVAA